MGGAVMLGGTVVDMGVALDEVCDAVLLSDVVCSDFGCYLGGFAYRYWNWRFWRPGLLDITSFQRADPRRRCVPLESAPGWGLLV